MHISIEQAQEVGARIGNTVLGSSVATVVADRVGVVTLEDWAFITTITCGLLGLFISVVLNVWHKLTLHALRREEIEIQRQVAMASMPGPSDGEPRGDA